MVAALAHDLSEKRGVSSTLLHYLSFVIDVKNAIGDGNVKTLVDEIKLSEVLILDDIGAEQSTAWVRDEILTSHSPISDAGKFIDLFHLQLQL